MLAHAPIRDPTSMILTKLLPLAVVKRARFPPLRMYLFTGSLSPPQHYFFIKCLMSVLWNTSTDMLLACHHHYCHNVSVARVEKLPLASLHSHDYGAWLSNGVRQSSYKLQSLRQNLLQWNLAALAPDPHSETSLRYSGVTTSALDDSCDAHHSPGQRLSDSRVLAVLWWQDIDVFQTMQ